MISRKWWMTFALIAVLVLASCSQSKLDRTINAVDAASLLPAALNLPEAEQKCATELFKDVSTALREMRKNPSYGAWGAVNEAVQKFDTANCIHNQRLIAIVKVLQAMTAEAPKNGPELEAARSGGNGGIRDEDLKALEALVKK